MARKIKTKSDRLEEEELIKILSMPDKRAKQGFRDFIILRMLADTGMRKGELVRLKIENIIDFEGGKAVYFESLKKRKIHRKQEFKEKIIKRLVPLREDMVELLNKYLKCEYGANYAEDKSRPLFRTLGKYGRDKDNKKGITAKVVDDVVYKYFKLAGINKHITPHSFRSTFASHLLIDKGVDVETVREMLGHFSLASTQVYLMSSDRKKLQAIKSLKY